MIVRSTSTRLLATALFSTMLTLAGCATNAPVATQPATVVAAAAQSAELSTFYKLVKDAGLTDTLQAAGPVTVFAPSDEAFKAMPADKLDKLSKDPAQLKALLAFHVIKGSVKAADIKENTSIDSLNGAKLNVSKAGDFVTVEDALVTKADLVADNGVVHIIDRVLTPPVKK